MHELNEAQDRRRLHLLLPEEELGHEVGMRGNENGWQTKRLIWDASENVLLRIDDNISIQKICSSHIIEVSRVESKALV